MTPYQGSHRRGGELRHDRRARGDDAPAPTPAPSRSRLLLVIGIGLIAIALVIGGFLIQRYMGASASHDRDLEASGLGFEPGADVPIDVKSNDLHINWDALKKINPDIVGWVLIPGTRINYPIVQTMDNDFYLTHLFDRSYSSVGAIFLDCDNIPTITGRNNMIYGHNMLDGSMFASLQEFRDQGFFDEHRTILLATPGHTYELQTVAVVVCEGDAELRQLQFSGDASFNSYLQELLSYAVVLDQNTVDKTDELYCFATCTDLGNTKRTILLATLLDNSAVHGAY